ncbi:MAG TPA: sensor histidine kinase [Verrucomicrobiae bacterium]
MQQLGQWPKRYAAPICIFWVTLVGLIDFITGYEFFFFIFYLLAVFLGTWVVGILFGILMSALSVTAWISSNIEAGAHYSSYFVPVWNAAIMFAFYLVVVALLAKLKSFYQELENRVQQRTESLAREIRERTRLQRELLEVGERERRRIGYELHDGLGQQLTGAALAGQFTSQKLAAKQQPEAGEVLKFVDAVEKAIELSRQLSRNLNPVELRPGRLLENFQEMAAHLAARHKIQCTFALHELGALPDVPTATQFYHIAEEAVVNAARHGRAKVVHISLEIMEDEISLSIADDGVGIATESLQQPGWGIRLMKHRSDLLGAQFVIKKGERQGTLVTCTLRPGSGVGLT